MAYGLRIKVRGLKEFRVWQENGMVKQSGIFSLPEVLEDFGDNKQGRFEAGAYISGMLKLQRIIES